MEGERLTQYLLTHIGTVLKEPRGFIRYLFIDPGAWYDGYVWDWDTFWCVKALFSVWDELTMILPALAVRRTAPPVCCSTALWSANWRRLPPCMTLGDLRRRRSA